MEMNDSSTDNPGTSVAKKPYEKPSFRCEQVFVTTALTCGKITSTQAGCSVIQKAS
jgi:hypothetical protein